MLYSYFLETPLGCLKIIADAAQVHSVSFIEGESRVECGGPCEIIPAAALAIQELTAYFAGNLESFTVKISPVGTAFQQSVWAATQLISYGQTCFYKNISSDINVPRAFRAVGSALGANPCAIITPCHRVVAEHGLGGYRYGNTRKEWLLKHEALYKK